MKKRVVLVLALTVFGGITSLLSACNTTAGAGKDVSAAGHAVTNTAEETKEKM